MKKQDLLIIKLQEQIKKQMSISQSSYTSAWLDIKQKLLYKNEEEDIMNLFKQTLKDNYINQID